jgi:LCP family protein required for cell wall assembly
VTSEELDDGRGRRRRHYAPPRHGRQKRGGHVILPAIAGVLVMVIALTGGYAAYSYTRLTGQITHVDAIPAASGSASARPDVDGKAQNILLVGDDHRPDNASPQELAQLGTQADGGSTNTDTMIVLHIAANGKSATLLSFPRDSYVQIPGVGYQKLNSAFYYGTLNGGGDAGGAQLLITTIQNMSGLTIDHFVRVSLLSFYEIVQALGPVQVCLNHAVKDHYSGINLPAGVSTLNASQALSFVRQRHGLPNGDFDRVVRQQYFLSQEAKQILSAGTLLNPVKLTKVLDAVGGSLQTDQGFDLLTLASQMRNLRPGNIKSATIPMLGTGTREIGGQALDVDLVDTAAMPALIQSLNGPPEAYTTAKAAAPASVHVTVVNGSGTTGAAAAATTTLQGLGFQTGAPGSSTTTANTVVEYPAGMEAQAKAVVAAVPGSAPVQTSTVSVVTLLLGTDGRTPQAPSTTPAAPAAPAAPATTAPSPSTSAAAPAPAPSPSNTAINTYGKSGACID